MRKKTPTKNILSRIPHYVYMSVAVVIVAVVAFMVVYHTNGKPVERNTAAQIASDDHWRKILTPEQYHILREAGTEIPFSGALDYETRPGTYYSYGCDKPIFRSEQKYDSGTGWPSFWAPIKEGAVVLRQSTELGDNRTEVLDTCGSHLGHVFDDGPEPTGKRYCMNSVAMYFVPDKK